MKPQGTSLANVTCTLTIKGIDATAAARHLGFLPYSICETSSV